MKKTRLLMLCAAASCSALALEQTSCAFEMTAWRSAMPPATSGNAVFSPAGFAIASAILGEGLGGEARVTLMETFGAMSDFSFLGTSHLLSHAAANASNRVDISVATSLWTTRRCALDKNYIHTIQQGFDAQAGYLRDISTVNLWTETKTGGRISNVLAEMPKRADTILINAVAFEGAWDKPFDDDLTRKSTFTLANGTKTSVPLMHKESEMLLIDRPRFRLCKLNFAAPNIHFILVLPKKNVTLAQLREKDITAKTMDGLKILLKSGESSEVKAGVAEFALPTFEAKSEWRLENALQSAKVPRKGFTRMGQGPFSIDDARQFTYFKVTEAGYSLTPGFTPEEPQRGASGRRSELSSASDEQEKGRSKPKLGTPVICDRPFLFFVWDSKTDSFLIAGQFTGIKS